MKNLKPIIGLAALLASISVQAQENALPPKVVKWLSFEQNIEAAKSVTFAAYPSYGKEIVIDGESRSWGFGLAAFYPVAKIDALSDNPIAAHTFTGLRLDYLAGQFYAPSVTIGINGHFQIVGHDFNAFGIGGGIVPLSDAGSDNNEIGGIYGAGVSTRLLSFGKTREDGTKPLTLSAFYAAEKWTLFSGYVQHLGAALTAKF